MVLSFHTQGPQDLLRSPAFQVIAQLECVHADSSAQLVPRGSPPALPLAPASCESKHPGAWWGGKSLFLPECILLWLNKNKDNNKTHQQSRLCPRSGSNWAGTLHQFCCYYKCQTTACKCSAWTRSALAGWCLTQIQLDVRNITCTKISSSKIYVHLLILRFVNQRSPSMFLKVQSLDEHHFLGAVRH